MYLSRLDIVGFKSFAQKTAFNFSEGLSALVGPNGCGKTNIVDAIRWVLGEKKASVLRSDVMENVIFNGTKSRKPLGMAEVILTIENNKNILPLEYSQVTVTRRLYRSGESEYLLNNTKCRLRDIYDLFLDTGMGSDSYSVIELKMVEAILSGKVEERRSMFEEAAGIKKYKLRRKETSRKLESVQQDLERVQDIVEEVRKNVNSLSRQAAKTRRYNKLTEELKELEIIMYRHELFGIKSDKFSLDNVLNELNNTKIKFESEINDEENSIKELKEKLHEVSKKHLSASENEKNITKEVAFDKEKLIAKKEKLTSFDANKTILVNQIEDTKAKINDLQNKHQQNLHEIDAQKSKLAETESKLDQALEKKKAALNQVNELRESTGSANEEVLELQNRINSLKSLINRNNLKRDNIENKISKNQEEKISLIQQIEDLDRDIDSAKAKHAELEIDHQNAEEEYNNELERKLSLQNTIDNLRDELSDKKNQFSSKNASLEFLESLSDNTESNKFLLNNDNWEAPFEKLLLGEAVGADEEYRIAVEAALGEYSHSFIVNSNTDADKAIDVLKLHSKGRASFIIRDLIPIISPLDEINETGCIGYLSEVVRGDDDVKNALRNILGKTVLVENMEIGRNLIASKKAERAVTLKGEILDNNGFKKGGSITKTEGQSIGKKERIDNLRIDIDNLQREIDGINDESDNLKDEINSIDINELKKIVKNVENELNSTAHKVNQLELKGTSIDDKVKLLEIHENNFNTEIDEISAENDKFSEELEDTEASISSSKETYQSILNELNEKEELYNQTELEVKNIDMDKININAEVRNLDKENTSIQNELISADIKIKAKNEELENGEEDKEKLQIEADELAKNIEILIKEKEDISTKVDFYNHEKNTLQEQYEQYADQINSKRREYDKIKEKIHVKDIKLSEINLRIENIVNKIRDDYQIDIDNNNFEPIDGFSIDFSRSEIDKIKSKLANIGNVNFLALEEYEQQNSRLDFYEKQMADLIESEKILTETMDEINTAAEKNFRDTFSKIRTNFQKLFKTLFGPEGEADITLATEDNPLESDIEIVAKPPYKRPHSIEMLSGGEKTLTAIALLFGIYLVKPSPFCILDEVDAPLDDNNIGKFINLIKEFSGETQFLIVTHNKGTMEAADTLYGITMQEDGVSKVVSVKVDGDEKKAEAA